MPKYKAGPEVDESFSVEFAPHTLEEQYREFDAYRYGEKWKAFGAMPQIMQVNPEQLWLMVGMMPVDILTHLPALLFFGWRKARKK